MIQYTYLLINFFTIIICFIFSFHPKIKFNRHFGAFIKASLLVGLVFILWDVWFYIGIGITLYGMSYFFVHDIFIHQRVKFLKDTKNPYLLAIRRAHKQHHKHINKEDGECFGFLWVPVKYFKMYFNKDKA